MASVQAPASATSVPAPLTADRLRPLLAGAQEIYVSGCSAEIVELPAMLDAAGVGATVTGIFSPILNRQSYAAPSLDRHCRTFFLNPALKNDLAGGTVQFCPWSYTEITQWTAAPGRFDAAIVMVSLPDASGNYSVGTQADFLPDFQGAVPRLIGVVNPAMPHTRGSMVHRDQFHALFTLEQSLLGLAPPAAGVDAISDMIAARVAELVPESATLQIGIGRIPQAVTTALLQHRGLRIHSGLIDDNILKLEQAGALNPDAPIVTGVAIGSQALYDHVDRNDRYQFRPASHTHGFGVIAQIPQFLAINGALEVDLFGQVNSEAGSGRLIASPGGLSDFMRGARQSPGGMSIVALRAKPGRQGRGGIVAQLDSPALVSLPRCDVDIVITENGVAHLRGNSIDARAEELIAIADPAEQPRLAEQWQAIRAKALL